MTRIDDFVIKKPVSISEIVNYPPSENKWLYENMRHKKKAPQSFKYKLDSEEIKPRLTKRIRALINKFDVIDSIRVYGRIGEQSKSIQLHDLSRGISYNEDGISFSVEDKEYKRFTEKSKVNCEVSGNYNEAVKHLAEIREFLNNLPRREALGK